MRQDNLSLEQRGETCYNFGLKVYNVSENFSKKQMYPEAGRYLSMAEENFRKAKELGYSPDDKDITVILREIEEKRKGLAEKLKELLKTNHLPAQCK